MVTSFTPILHYELISVPDLDFSTIDRLYLLMDQNYNNVNFDSFRNDLSKKQFIGVLKDNNNSVQGFTTYAINPSGTGTNEYNILFSGDTIISPDYWGTQELAKGWCKTIGRLMAGSSGKKWFWFLMSKGHRTYMYLPLFFEKYYPALDKNNETDIFPVIDKCSRAMYPRSWRAEKGVISFEESHGELKEVHVEGTFKKTQLNRHARFFLERNPGFVNGDELTCMAELSLGNFKRFKLEIIEGMKKPLEFNYD